MELLCRRDPAFRRAQSRAPLLEAMLSYARARKTSFHTPGHKHGIGIHPLYRNFTGRRMFQLDLTLLPEVDSLHHPTGVIREAQELAGKAFGADHSFFLVQGSTGGNQALLFAALGPGDTVIVPRNIHKSVIAGLALCGARPVFLHPARDRRFNLFTGVTPGQVEQALAEHPEARGVYLTRPTYHGLAADLPAIAEAVHRSDKLLLVDEAHGPHFGFHEALPLSAMQCGADAAVQSVHKIIGGMTQASILHVRNDRLDLASVRRALTTLQTTSPSYLLMASLDAARMQMALSGRRMMIRALRLAEELRAALSRIEGLELMDPTEMEGAEGMGFDATKITVRVTRLGLSGFEVARMLDEEHDVQIEYADFSNILFLVSYANSQKDLDRTIRGLTQIAALRSHRKLRYLSERKVRLPELSETTELTPREATFAEKRIVPLEQSEGEVAAETITPYPPGIPVLVPGERIRPEVVEYLQELAAAGTRINGYSDPEAQYLAVVARPEEVGAVEEAPVSRPAVFRPRVRRYYFTQRVFRG